jgi:hypothetical protein
MRHLIKQALSPWGEDMETAVTAQHKAIRRQRETITPDRGSPRIQTGAVLKASVVAALVLLWYLHRASCVCPLHILP